MKQVQLIIILLVLFSNKQEGAVSNAIISQLRQLLSLPFSPQRFTHRRAGVCLCHGIEVAVDILRGPHVAMSEPFLDLPCRYALK